jgi:hypothetical protein
MIPYGVSALQADRSEKYVVSGFSRTNERPPSGELHKCATRKNRRESTLTRQGGQPNLRVDLRRFSITRSARTYAAERRSQELQEGIHNRAPLFVEIAARDRFGGCSVPVRGVRLVTLAAVQIGVYPRAVRAGDVLRDLVRAIPVASSLVPQRCECAMHAVGWREPAQGCFELGKIHVDRIARPRLIALGGPGAIREACVAKRK